MSEIETNVYIAAGGMPTFQRLAATFYEGVALDPLLRPLYPESLHDAEMHLALFLAQYFGGPPAYSNLRGHPRLRMRHVPFSIGKAERDAWVAHMLDALDTLDLDESLHAEMKRYFEDAATFLINRESDQDAHRPINL